MIFGLDIDGIKRQVERQVREAIGRVDDGQLRVDHGLSRRRTLVTIRISAADDPVLNFYQSGPMVLYPCERSASKSFSVVYFSVGDQNITARSSQQMGRCK